MILNPLRLHLHKTDAASLLAYLEACTASELQAQINQLMGAKVDSTSDLVLQHIMHPVMTKIMSGLYKCSLKFDNHLKLNLKPLEYLAINSLYCESLAGAVAWNKLSEEQQRDVTRLMATIDAKIKSV
jgi:DNA-binding protein Fis